MASTPIRFTGLSSGMDTEAIVKAMLTTQQNKIDKQTRKQQLYNWRQEAWKDMNSKIASFQEKYIDKLRLQSTFMKSKVTTSNDAAISVNGNSMVSGSHKVSIKQLATSAYMMTSATTATVKPISETTKLSELGITETTKLRLETKDTSLAEEITIGPDSNLADLRSELGKKGIDLNISDNQIKLSSSTGMQIKVIDNDTDSNPDTMSGDSKILSKLGLSSTEELTIEKDKEVVGSQLRSDKVNGTTKLGHLLSSSGTPIITSDQKITVNGEEVTLSANDTINDLIRKIKEKDSNLSVNFDSNNKQFFVNSNITGKDSKTDIKGTDASATALLSALGLVQKAGTEDTTQGKNALYSYNGMGNVTDSSDSSDSNLYYESSSNTVNINGIEMTFKATTTEPITIQGTSNTEEIVKFVKEFVSEYNKLMEDINTKLTTKTSSKYEPLTDEEKENTSDANVEKIENYVKEGLFYRDSALTQVRDTLRDTLGEVVGDNSTYKTLYSIGITTGEWRENGKLYLDEEALTKALEDKPEEVMNLFAGSSTQESGKGIFNRVNDSFKALSKSTDYRTFGSFYNDKEVTEQLKATVEKIATLNDQYNTKETALYKKFTAMEKMMSQLNTQQSYLTSMLGQ